MTDWLEDPDLSAEQKLAIFEALPDGGEVEFVQAVVVEVEAPVGIAVSAGNQSLRIRQSRVLHLLGDQVALLPIPAAGDGHIRSDQLAGTVLR